jgi:predicted NBD/HSP70 family sugar kinase
MLEFVAHHLKPTGSNHVGMRQFNERIVLQTIRLHAGLSKAQIARLTRLSGQTVAGMIDHLIEDGLLLKGEPQKGKIGQPSVPIFLNPEGAYSIGIGVGRTRLDVQLMDFTGRVKEQSSLDYKFPDPEMLFREIAIRIKKPIERLGPQAERLVGVGVSAPFSFGGWKSLWGEWSRDIEAWNEINIKERIQAMTPLPVEFSRDTAAACVAELVAGQGRSVRSYLYLYLDTFIGGGLVIDSHLHSGTRGNAGAVGSLPLGVYSKERPKQLLEVASLWNLEQLYRAGGLDIAAIYDARALQEPWLSQTQTWLDAAAKAIALTVTTSASILDIEGVIVDGTCQRALLEALLGRIDQELSSYNWEGIFKPKVLPGSIGPGAQAMGAALLPLYAHFAPDRDLFLKLAT